MNYEQCNYDGYGGHRTTVTIVKDTHFDGIQINASSEVATANLSFLNARAFRDFLNMLKEFDRKLGS